MLKESISFCIFLLEWGLFLCFECCVVAIRQQHYWQAVSSCRGPIYRARISEYTHKMTNGNTCAVKWIHVYNNVEMRIR